MKTAIYLRLVRNIIIALLILEIILVAATFSLASAQQLTLNIDRSISGCGFGTAYSPSIGLSGRSYTLLTGPSFQQQKMNFSGWKTEFRFMPFHGRNNKATVYFYGNTTYHHAAYMSKSCISTEQMVSHNDNNINCHQQFRAIEAYAGFGVRFLHTNKLSTGINIGAGFYNTLDHNYLSHNLYREKQSGSLQLGISLTYKLGK